MNLENRENPRPRVLRMLGPQTLGDYGYLRSTKELSVGHLGYFGHPQLETVNTEGSEGFCMFGSLGVF